MTRSDVLDFIGRFKEEDNLHPAHRFYQITSSAAVSTRNKLATLQHGSAGIHFVGRGGFSRNFSLQLGVASNFRRSLTSRVAKQNPVPEGNESDVATLSMIFHGVENVAGSRHCMCS